MDGFTDKIADHKGNFETENKAPSGDRSGENSGKNAQRHSKVSEDPDGMEPSREEKHWKMLEIIRDLEGASVEVRELRRRAEEEGLVDEKEIGGFFHAFLERGNRPFEAPRA